MKKEKIIMWVLITLTVASIVLPGPLFLLGCGRGCCLIILVLSPIFITLSAFCEHEVKILSKIGNK